MIHLDVRQLTFRLYSNGSTKMRMKAVWKHVTCIKRMINVSKRARQQQGKYTLICKYSISLGVIRKGVHRKTDTWTLITIITKIHYY